MRQFFFLFLIFSFFGRVWAQDGEAPAFREAGLPFVQNFGPKVYGGMRQNMAIAQDHRGVMYFGQTSFVFEYDGVSWRPIPTDYNITTLSLAADETGRIFVGSQGEFGYLSPDARGRLHYVSLMDYVDVEDRDFTNVTETLATSQGIYFRTHKYLFRWQTGQRQAKDGTLEGDLHVWKPQTNFERITVVQDTVYVLQHDVGLMKVVGDALQNVITENVPSDIVVMLPFPDAAQKKLVVTRSSLFLFDGAVFEPFEIELTAGYFLQKNGIQCATVLGDSTLAIGTRLGGVAILDTQGRLRHVLNKAAGLQDDRVFKLYPDREGGLWIAYENGLSRVETPSRFSLFNETLGAGGLVRKLIRHQGKLYVADHRGLFVLSPPDTPGGFPTFQLGPDIPRNYWFVRSVDQTLLGATGDGIVVIEDGREPKVIHQRASLRIYPSRYYSNLAFAGSIDSLAVLQKNEGEWAFVGHFENVYGSVRNIEEEGPGVFWVSTRVSGNYRITMPHLQNIKAGKVPKMDRDDLTGQVERYEEKHGADNGTLVLSIGDQIAFRHPNGLRRFDGDAKMFVPEPTFGELFAENSVYRLAEDPAKGMWMFSDGEMGLAVVDEDGALDWYTTPFLRLGDFQINRIYPDPKHAGVIWIGGRGDGIVRYDSTVHQNYKTNFSALIRRVTVGQDTLFYGADTARHDTLLYASNALRVAYAAASFNDPSQNRFQVLLDGFDKDWSAWTDETQKDYTNLPEGTFTFRVRATNI